MELEHEPDLAVPDGGQFGGALLPIGSAIEANRAAGRCVERPQQMQEGALAGPARADDGHELAPAHLEIDAGEDLDLRAVSPTVDLPEPRRLENRAHSWRIASTGVSDAADCDG